MLELQKWKEAKLPKLSSEVELRYIHQRTGEEVYGEKYGFVPVKKESTEV